MSTVVETAYGPVRGVDDGRVTAWKGVRYAAPPTGMPVRNTIVSSTNEPR